MAEIKESNLKGYPELSDHQKLYLMSEIQRIFNNKYECVSDHSKEWLTYNAYLIQAIGMSERYDTYDENVYEYVNFIMDELRGHSNTLYSDALDEITGYSLYLSKHQNAVNEKKERLLSYQGRIFEMVKRQWVNTPHVSLAGITALDIAMQRYIELENSLSDDL